MKADWSIRILLVVALIALNIPSSLVAGDAPNSKPKKSPTYVQGESDYVLSSDPAHGNSLTVDVMAFSSNSALPVVKEGKYTQYKFYDAVRVGATMLANPSRLGSVAMGVVYSPGTINEQSANVHDKVYAGFKSGQIGLASQTEQGEYVVGAYPDPDFDSVHWRKVFINACQSSLNSGAIDAPEQSEECRAEISKWLQAAEEKNAKVIVSTPKFKLGPSEGRVINWDAESPIANASIKVQENLRE